MPHSHAWLFCSILWLMFVLALDILFADLPDIAFFVDPI